MTACHYNTLVWLLPLQEAVKACQSVIFHCNVNLTAAIWRCKCSLQVSVVKVKMLCQKWSRVFFFFAHVWNEAHLLKCHFAQKRPAKIYLNEPGKAAAYLHLITSHHLLRFLWKTHIFVLLHTNDRPKSTTHISFPKQGETTESKLTASAESLTNQLCKSLELKRPENQEVFLTRLP